MSESNHGRAESVLDIRPGFFFLAFFLYFFRPQYSINGSPPVVGQWKRNTVPVPPGRYQVTVWVPYLFRPTMGISSIVVDVPAGAAAVVTWRAPFTIFGTGRIQVAGIEPVSGGAPVQGPPQAQGGYSQPQSGQPQYGQPQYGQPQYGQPQYGQPQYGQAQYSQPQYGQPPAAQPQYGQPPAAQPQSAQPQQAASASGAADWHPDPTGRHQLRYFDGSRWTEHVADGPNRSSDPLQG